MVPLRFIDAHVVAASFENHFVFKDGVLRTGLSDNGSHFASKMFQGMCQSIGIENMFKSTYHNPTHFQKEHYNWNIATMIPCYVADFQRDW